MKDKFELLANVPNEIPVSDSELQKYLVQNGNQYARAIIKVNENRINHFTKKRVMKLVDSAEIKRLQIVNMPNYPLAISCSSRNDKILLNLHAFGVEDINRMNPNNVYASIVYGICLSDLMRGRYKVKDNDAGPIISFLLSVFVRLFGKQYGLLGSFTGEIIKIKFLLACYILAAFFEFDKNKLYRHASMLSTYDYSEIEENLPKYDFSRITDLIRALSELKAMPGLSKHIFSAKMFRSMSLEFIPAIEDLARFYSVMSVAGLTGSSLVPTHIPKYNEVEFNKILGVVKHLFR